MSVLSGTLGDVFGGSSWGEKLGSRGQTTRPVITRPPPPPKQRASIILGRDSVFGGGRGSAVIGGDNRPYRSPNERTEEEERRRRTGADQATIILGRDSLFSGGTRTATVGEDPKDDFKGIRLPQWGTFKQLEHDRLAFMPTEAFDYGYDRYFSGLEKYRPKNYDHIDLYDKRDIEKLRQTVDVYQANLADKLINVLDSVEGDQAELERLISLNPDVAHGVSVEDTIEKIGGKIGDIIGTISEQRTREMLIKKLKDKLGRVLSNRIVQQVRDRLTRLGERGYTRMTEAGIKGERVMGAFEKINEALTTLSVETEVLRDLSEIALLASHGEGDSITRQKIKDMMGVTWYQDNVYGKSEVLGLLGDVMGMGIYKDLVEASTNVYELAGGRGTEFDSARFDRLTGSLKKASEQNQRLTKVNADVLESIHDQMLDMKQRNKDKNKLYRTADLAAQKYGISGDLQQNIINARKFYHLTTGRKPTVADNLFIREVANLMTRWKHT